MASSDIPVILKRNVECHWAILSMYLKDLPIATDSLWKCSYRLTMDSSTVYSLVRTHYGDLATRPSGLEVSHENIAKAFGYEPSELHSIPQDANLGVGCGNPLALAKLREVRTPNQEIMQDLTLLGRNSRGPWQWWGFGCHTSSP